MTSPDPHRVAVVVFLDVVAPTELDAAAAAEREVRLALETAGGGTLPVQLPRQVTWATVTARRVLEAGVAIGNGYLWSSPTRKAWRS